MKKEEFPTFLNEQPTIIFGRTGRELLIITIGLGQAYACWSGLGTLIPGSVILTDIIKGFLAVLVIVLAFVIAFTKIATRPLEEWAIVWVFYLIIPKVYIYMPIEESVLLDADDVKAKNESSSAHSDDEDDY